jgi:uncharacterized protein YqeY
MKLQEQIQSDLKAAMLNRDEDLKSFLRVVLGEINQKGKEVDDEISSKILRTMRNNAELMQNPYEIEVIDRYLPRMLNADEIKVIINEIITENGFKGKADMGKVMGKLKTHEKKALIDGTISSKITIELLS